MRRLATYVGGRNVLIQGVTLALSFPLSLIVSRHLGPDGRGDFSLTSMSAAIAALVAGAGVPDATPYLVAQRGRGHGVERVLADFTAVTGIVVATAYALLAGPILRLMHVAPTPGLIAGGTAVVFLLGVWPFWNNVGTAHGRTGLPLEAEALRVVIYLLGASAAIATGILTAPVALAAYAVSYVLAGTAVIARIGALGRPEGTTAAGIRRQALALGWRGMTARLLEYGATRVDAFIVGAIAGVAAAGAYVTATGIAEVLAFSANANVPPVIHRVSTEAAAGRPWGRFLAGRVLGSAALTFAGALVLLAVAPAFVRFALGVRFTSAVTPLRILAFSAVLLAVTRVLRHANFALGRMASNWTADLVSIAVLVTGNLLLLGRWGITASAWVMLVANLSAALILTTGLGQFLRRRAPVAAGATKFQSEAPAAP